MATASVTAAVAAASGSLALGDPATLRQKLAPRCSAQTLAASQSTYARLDTRASRALVAVLGRGASHRKRLGFIRAAARPCAALPRGGRVRWTLPTLG